MQVAILFPLLVLATGIVGDQDARLVATFVVEPDPNFSSSAVFEIDGRQLTRRVGDLVGGCSLIAVGEKNAELRCADGELNMTLLSGVALAADPQRDSVGERYQVQLPRMAFQSALLDRQKIAGQVSLEPYVRDGYLYGYRIAWLKPGGDFQQLGLLREDVITSLNTVPASQPGAFMQAVNGLRGQSSFSIAVDREGERIDYTYLLQ
jgi:type II secretion system protein C